MSPIREHLIHADVHRIGIEGIDQFVEQVEHNFVHVGVRRAPLAAVDVLVVLRNPRRLVELRVLREQRARLGAPGLMAEAVHQRNQADPVLAADSGKLPSLILLRPRVSNSGCDVN